MAKNTTANKAHTEAMKRAVNALGQSMVQNIWGFSPLDLRERVKYKSRFSPAWQDLSSKFGCPVLSGQETHMPNPNEP